MNILLVSGLFSTAESYGRGTATTEIIIMLLGAFILGYLLRYFLSRPKINELETRINLLEKELNECRKNNKQLTADLDICCHNKNQLAGELDICHNNNKQLLVDLDKYKNQQTYGIAQVEEVDQTRQAQQDEQSERIAIKKDPSIKDDLKIIEGIGPKIEQLLYAEEIYTWDDLSKTEVSFIQAVLDKAGPRYKVHNPESWPFQAEMAVKGEWEKLEKWQEEHKGGRF